MHLHSHRLAGRTGNLLSHACTILWFGLLKVTQTYPAVTKQETLILHLVHLYTCINNVCNCNTFILLIHSYNKCSFNHHVFITLKINILTLCSLTVIHGICWRTEWSASMKCSMGMTTEPSLVVTPSNSSIHFLISAYDKIIWLDENKTRYNKLFPSAHFLNISTEEVDINDDVLVLRKEWGSL